MTTSDETLVSRECVRMFTLDDMTVRSDGGGRIVEAYAAVFNRKAEIRDRDGHYRESLSRTSFNKTIGDAAPRNPGDPYRFGVLFNHGRTIDGTPADSLTLPLGIALDVRTDERGVFTATEYLDHPMADNVLNAIKRKALRAQSFSGKFVHSVRAGGSGRDSLPTITRTEVAMREYGPAVFAAYADAEILGTRAAELFVRTLMAQPEDERLEWLAALGIVAAPQSTSDAHGIPIVGTAATSPEPHEHSDGSVSTRIREWKKTHNPE